MKRNVYFLYIEDDDMCVASFDSVKELAIYLERPYNYVLKRTSKCYIFAKNGKRYFLQRYTKKFLLSDDEDEDE